MELTDEIYKLTKKFPDEERYGLISQMRRSAVSIPSNIAEGCRRNSKGSYIQFLSVAFGSGGELETQMEICKRNLALSQAEYKIAENLLEEVMKMLNKLISNLRTTNYDLQTNEGFIALLTVLLVSVSTLLMATTLIFLSGSESLQGFQATESSATLQIGDSCIEEALFRLKNLATYSGGNIAVGDGSCDVTLTGSGLTRDIISSSTIITQIGSFTRRITASTTIATNSAGNATTTDIIRWRE